jgi:hypothetical protein
MPDISVVLPGSDFVDDGLFVGDAAVEGIGTTGQRGPGNWGLIHKQAARCRDLGVSVTFIAVMMRSNFDRPAEIAEIVKTYDEPLRINVYQSVRSVRGGGRKLKVQMATSRELPELERCVCHGHNGRLNERRVPYAE